MDIIKIGMAELKTGKAPQILTTLGLGSCVGVTLYDKTLKIGGMVHIMLPDSKQMRNNVEVAKFADTGIQCLMDSLIKQGANQKRLVAKMAGGAQMFEFKHMEETLRIGARNIAASKEMLKKLNIPIQSSDVGANYGRTIELHLENGILLVKTIGKGYKEI
ncbi:chemotaxis protein CheD [Candidatus Epulonipiscium fishelsonii]|uniref:Chemotaxis protein CheD n=1 Tax=Candidatus Epulonipiscium fishelsonii TaxID=77094 RepID=A0ACC8X8F0_9FIRM|nr:chemotaxis protein CheD [Epulopiscium sp. SCG-D08WGA-EpuloA1]